MNQTRFHLSNLGFMMLASFAHAGPRSSANYTVFTDATGTGGKRITSTSYTNIGCSGGVVGVSTAAVSGIAKQGFIAQIAEVNALQIIATSSQLNEDNTLQLDAWQVLDDDTLLATPASSIAWSVASGPLTGIDANGLATAGSVYQDTGASVQGNYQTFTGNLGLSVMNTQPDNFASYAGDSIDDAWQVQYFGLPPNSSAGPQIDPDGDGQSNKTEWTALTDPRNPNSRFAAATVRNGANLEITVPTAPGRTYTLFQSATLQGGSWIPVPGIDPQPGNGSPLTFQIPIAAGSLFFQVRVTVP